MVFFYAIFLIQHKNVQTRKNLPVLRIQKMHVIFSPITMLKFIKNCLYKYCTLYRITFCNILILNSSSHVHEERNGKQRRSLNEAQVARAMYVACGALRSSSRKWQEQCQHSARQRRLLCKRCVRAGNMDGGRERTRWDR